MTPNAQHTVFRWRAVPKSPFHFGDRGDRASTDLWPRSDTVFGAFLAAWALRPESGRSFFPEGQPPDSSIQFSSLFPAWGRVRFLPRPYVRVKLQTEDAADRKAFGKVRFVSESVFPQLLHGGPIAFGRHLRIGDLFLLHPDDLPGGPARWERSGRPPVESLLETDTIAGNVLDRVTSAADTFRRAAVRFNQEDGCRLWGLVRCPADAADAVQAALAELGRQGLGGLRSIGFGAFEVESFEPLPAADPLAPLLRPPEPSATHLCLLSLYHPTRAEVEGGVIGEDDPHVAYDALRRGGWIWSAGDTALRKRTIRMLTEGSVVRRVGGGPTGDIVDVTPEAFRSRPRSHTVWRDGRAFGLAFSPKEVNDDE